MTLRSEAPHYLRVALALSGALSSASCGSGTKAAESPKGTSEPAATSTTSATSTDHPSHGTDTATKSSVVAGSDDEGATGVTDFTSGAGPCRCSWYNAIAAAPRVCRKGETAFDGATCIPNARKYKHHAIGGPQPPPELASR